MTRNAFWPNPGARSITTSELETAASARVGRILAGANVKAARGSSAAANTLTTDVFVRFWTAIVNQALSGSLGSLTLWVDKAGPRSITASGAARSRAVAVSACAAGAGEGAVPPAAASAAAPASDRKRARTTQPPERKFRIRSMEFRLQAGRLRAKRRECGRATRH